MRTGNSEPHAAALTRYDLVVVGSGAGGAVTAAHAAQAGLRVLILEEGEQTGAFGNAERFTLNGMNLRLRRGGQQVAFGKPMIAWGEGIGVGGGTEVNSGLYHRVSNGTLERWAETHLIAGLSPAEMETRYTEIETELQVALNPHGLSRSATLMAVGADAQEWRWQEIPRWVRHHAGGFERLTMRTTYLRRALEAGAEIRAGARVRRVEHDRGAATGVWVECIADRERQFVAADAVFVCAGAVESAKLLRRSRLGRHVGHGLQFHPMVKIAAMFDDVVNSDDDMGTVQVLEHAPRITIGAAASAPAVMGAALARSELRPDAIAQRWERSVLWYAAVCPESSGTVHRNGLVRYPLSDGDIAALRDGARMVARIAFAAGARDVVPSAARSRVVTDADAVVEQLTRDRIDLTTVHVSSGLAMGERRDRCTVDSWGRVHGSRNVYVNDAGMLPGAPGVNPQGVVMAIAIRNIQAYLQGRS